MEKKPAMAYAHPNPSGAPAQHRRPLNPAVRRAAAGRTAEGDHHLEKLEFALAVARSRGDAQRSAVLLAQIEALGGNQEEPGT